MPSWMPPVESAAAAVMVRTIWSWRTRMARGLCQQGDAGFGGSDAGAAAHQQLHTELAFQAVTLVTGPAG
jgi:hypothetical protein